MLRYLHDDDPDTLHKVSLLKLLSQDLIAWDGITPIEKIYDRHPLLEEYFSVPPALEALPEYTSVITKDDVRRVLTNYPPELFSTEDIFRWECLMFDSNSIDCDLTSTRSALQHLTMGGFDEKDRQIALGMLEP